MFHIRWLDNKIDKKKSNNNDYIPFSSLLLQFKFEYVQSGTLFLFYVK